MGRSPPSSGNRVWGPSVQILDDTVAVRNPSINKGGVYQGSAMKGVVLRIICLEGRPSANIAELKLEVVLAWKDNRLAASIELTPGT